MADDDMEAEAAQSASNLVERQRPLSPALSGLDAGLEKVDKQVDKIKETASIIQKTLPRIGAEFHNPLLRKLNEAVAQVKADTQKIAEIVQADDDQNRRHQEMEASVMKKISNQMNALIQEQKKATEAQTQATEALIMAADLMKSHTGKGKSQGSRDTIDLTTTAAAADVLPDAPLQANLSTTKAIQPNDRPLIPHRAAVDHTRTPGTKHSYEMQTASSAARSQLRSTPSTQLLRPAAHTTGRDLSGEDQSSTVSVQSDHARTSDPSVGTTAQGGAYYIRPSSSTTQLAKQSSSASLRPDFQSQSATSHPDRSRSFADIQAAKRPASTPEPAKGPTKRRNVSSETDQPSPSPTASGLASDVTLHPSPSGPILTSSGEGSIPPTSRSQSARSTPSTVVPRARSSMHDQARPGIGAAVGRGRNIRSAPQQAAAQTSPFSAFNPQEIISETSQSMATAARMQPHPSSAAATLPSSRPVISRDYGPYRHPSVSQASFPPGTSQDAIITEAFNAQRRLDATTMNINRSDDYFGLQKFQGKDYHLGFNQLNIYRLLEKPQGWTREEEKLLRYQLARNLVAFYKPKIDEEVHYYWNSGKLQFPGKCFLHFPDKDIPRVNHQYMISQCAFAADADHKEGRGCLFLTYTDDCDPFVVGNGVLNTVATDKNMKTNKWASSKDKNGHRYYLFRRLTQKDLDEAQRAVQKRDSGRRPQEGHDISVIPTTDSRRNPFTGELRNSGSVQQEISSAVQYPSGAIGQALTTSGDIATPMQDVIALGQTLASTSFGKGDLTRPVIGGASQERLGRGIDPASEGETGSRYTERQAGEEDVEDEDMHDSPLPSGRSI